jgi:diguanylate cyclase (GGDEF)-like protein
VFGAGSERVPYSRQRFTRGTALTKGHLAILWALASLAPALPLQASEGSARFVRLSVEEGLPQSSVENILQDRLGFLWFGTQEGLSRYDGYRFVVHRAQNKTGFLRDHSVLSLIQDRVGDLWIGTQRGLHRLDLATGRIDREAAESAELTIPRVIEDASGRIWFTTSAGGLWVLQPGEPGKREGRRVATPSVPANVPMAALARAQGSSIWAVADGRLLLVESEGHKALVTEVLSGLGKIRVLAADSRGRLWMAGRETELVRYDSASGRLDRFPQAPRAILSLLPLKDGALWIGGRASGLSHFDPEKGTVVTYRHDHEDPSSLSKDDVAALHEDRLGNLWIGCWNGGVNMLDPYGQAFRTFKRRPTVADSLPDDDVISMTETPDGRLWLGSRNGVVGVGDPRAGRFARAAQFPFRIPTLGWSGETLVYAGTDTGLLALDRKSGHRVLLPKAMREAGLDARPISKIQRGAEDDLWISSQQQLFRVRAADGSVTRFDPPVKSPISSILVLSNQEIWIGSESGELVFGKTAEKGGVTFRPFVERDAGREGSLATRGLVTSLHQDKLGRLWVGTWKGLGRIDSLSADVVWLDEGDDLPSTNISGLLADSPDALWAATNRGLTRIDLKTLGMAHFGTREGAQGSGYADGAYAKGSSGLLYFAGTGVTAFDPQEVRVDPRRPGIAFTSLEILRRAVQPRWLDPRSPLLRTIDSTDALTLSSDANVFAVELAALHYNDPQGVRFAYRLDGFDPDWIETDAQNRVATYTGLLPGHYKLRARARPKNGAWSEQEATLAIHVLPPWWRAPPAIVGWIGLSVLATSMVIGEMRRRNRVRIALLERETLLHQSLTDPLTGLYNRRFATTYLQHEIPRSLRDYATRGPDAGDTFSDLLFFLIDVDHFKSINDEHSHAAGDRVLAGIAKVLHEHIRDSDLAVRWGGDELFIVSRSIGRNHASRAAERLRAAVEALGLEMAAARGPACTISIGYAAFPFLPHDPQALTWEQTLDIADRGLLLAKQNGRNSHTGLLAGAELTAKAMADYLSEGPDAPLPAGLEIVRA